MCLCLECLWSALIYLFTCQCLRTESEIKRTAKRRRRKSPIKSVKYSTTARTLDRTDLKTTSKLERKELLNKYRIEIPKMFSTREVFLQSKGYKVLWDSPVLGKGAFGKVYKAIRYEGEGRQRMVACKVMPITLLKATSEESVVNEIYTTDIVLEKSKQKECEHIIHVYDVWLVEEMTISDFKRNALMFMELSTYGSLEDEIKKFGPLGEVVAKRYFSHLVRAIDYMHEVKIAHRDIKPSNLLIFKDVHGQKILKLTDFGLSRIHYDEGKGYTPLKKVGGTGFYKAPEIIEKSIKSNKRMTINPYKADIWAMGVCLFMMLTRSPPFPGTGDQDQLDKQNEKVYDYPDSPQLSISRSAKDLIARLLEPNPNRRLAIQQVKQHKWLVGEVTLSLTTQPD